MYIGVVLGDGAGRDDVSRFKNKIKHVEEDGKKGRHVGNSSRRLLDDARFQLVNRRNSSGQLAGVRVLR